MSISDEQAAERLARTMLGDISSQNTDRFERAGDRLHELKGEIAQARKSFREQVATEHHDVFERAVRAWARRSKAAVHHEAAPAEPAPHVELGLCDHCGRPNGPDATKCASCGFSLPRIEAAEVRPPEAQKNPRIGDGERSPVEAKPEESHPEYWLYAVIGLALIAAMALADHVGEIRMRAREAADDSTSGQRKEPGDHSRTSGVLPAVLIPSCTCWSPNAMAAVEAKLLAPPLDGSQPWTLEVRRNFEWSTSKVPLALRDDAVLSPGLRTIAPRLGVACGNAVFVLVARDVVTAWSFDGSWKWNTHLPAPLADERQAPPDIPATPFKTACLSLATDTDDVVVPMSSGASAKVALSDGRIVP